MELSPELLQFLSILGFEGASRGFQLRVLRDLGIFRGTQLSSKGKSFAHWNEDRFTTTLDWLLTYFQGKGHPNYYLIAALLSIALPRPVIVPRLHPRNHLGLDREVWLKFMKVRHYDPDLLRWSLLAGMPAPPELEDLQLNLRPTNQSSTTVAINMMACQALLASGSSLFLGEPEVP